MGFSGPSFGLSCASRIFDRRNVLLLILSMELMMLAVSMLMLIGSQGFGDSPGWSYAVHIIAVTGAESALT